MLALTALVVVAGAVRSIVLQGQVPIKANQPPASVAVIMVDGRAENKGCSGGILYTGHFVVSVHSTTGNRDTDLNALLDAETLSFPEHSYWHTWPIQFADFNHDGQPDFSIAPHFCGNNGQYSLLTIASDGRVRRIAVVPDGSLWISDGAPSSSAITVVSDGIQIGAYDNSMGSGVTRRYRWEPARHAFIFAPPAPASGK
jgi:hypothetical protein